MLENVLKIAGNGAVDSPGAEQEDSLLEQCGTCFGHNESSTDFFEKHEHAEGSLNDLDVSCWG